VPALLERLQDHYLFDQIDPVAGEIQRLRETAAGIGYGQAKRGNLRRLLAGCVDEGGAFLDAEVFAVAGVVIEAPVGHGVSDALEGCCPPYALILL
jgi:hypothetical protein